ncbi:MAG: flagellin [Fusobacteriota bacterium]
MKITGAYGGANYQVLANQNKSNERLSSGKRINSASDDAAGLSISQKMESQAKGLGVELRNIQTEMSSYQVQDSALETISRDLNQLNELAVQYNNGTLAESDREVLQNQANEILENINTVANETEFNGQQVVSEFNAEGLNLEENPLGEGALRAIEDAFNQIGEERGNIGSEINSLESQTSRIMVAQENSFAANSRIQDADMLMETLNNTKAKIMDETNQAVNAQQMNMSQNRIMDILKG